MVLLSRVPGIQLSGRRLDSTATIRRQLTIAHQGVTIGYLNGKTNAEMEPTLRAADQTT
jgi:hypothetical protein